ncbi:ISKra4 family transposase [Glaciimonas sp. GG7]
MRVDIEVRIGGKRNRICVATIERDANTTVELGIGLQLAEVKSLIGRLQQIVATAQAEEVIAANCLCGRCGEPLPRKGSASIVYRTAFGKLHLNSPRYYSTCICGHSRHESASFNPLAERLTERSHQEFVCLQTRWATTVLYERASALLADVLPIDAVPCSSSIKDQVRKVGRQIDKTARYDTENFFNSMPLRLPDPPLEQPRYALPVDAGYIRSVPARCHGRCSFAIIAARLRHPDGPSASMAYVNDEMWSALDRFHHFLHQHDVPIDAPVAIISDGGDDVAYPSYLPWRPVQRILDWFYIAMRFEHILQQIRGMRHSQPDDAAILMKKVEPAKWRLWHGRAQGAIERLREVGKITTSKLQKQVQDMIGYLGSDQSRLINYAACYRAGLPISTSLAESAVNFVIGDRFKKKGQMRWTLDGANALLHIRVEDLNGELADIFKKPLYVKHSKFTQKNLWEDFSMAA